jgi:hypothetical protein
MLKCTCETLLRMMDKVWRIVSIVGVASAVSPITIDAYELALRAAPSNRCATGIGTLQAPPLAFEGSVDTTKGANHWYNFTLTVGNDCYSLGILSFQVRSPNGTAAMLPANSGVAVATPSEEMEAEFNLGVGWVYESGFSANTLLTSQNTLSPVYSGGTPSSLVGDTLSILSPIGSCTGAIT